MMTLGTFYRQTWWLWVMFVLCLGVLAYVVSLVFLVGIPVLIVYSIYFGIVRVGEIRKEEEEKMRDGKGM
jgi:hypothetical protein